MAKAAATLLTEPRRPKTGQGRPLLVLRLARCEGRFRLLYRGLLVVIITFAPAQVTEGVLPCIRRRVNFYVSGASWAKFHTRYPSVSFEEFWENRVRVYELRNAETKRFFTEF